MGEIKEKLGTGAKEDLQLAYDKICEVSKTMETAANEVKDATLEDEKTFEQVRAWSEASKDDLIPIRELRSSLKQELVELERQETNKREEDWLKKKLELEIMLEEKRAEHENSKPQAVKLQEYTIPPFRGDCKNWFRFWNQLVVEVDSSKISEISKFNYLLELVQGEPKNCILGLPHTIEGYLEAKKTFEMTFGKDVKVHKALIKDLESLPNITSVSRIKDIHDFYGQLSRTVRTLATMKKLQGAQSYVYNIMDKLGPVREAMVQKDDKWEEWGLEELVENLRKYTDRNPLSESLTPSNEVKKPLTNQGSH
ncbi:uncharacterized protein LOC111329007 [Stylophora pistillata]|uniref:uncharacterized protein LOC111329007 n=1 Tax=Stylophora pistillata TaxID=50429 RepID=UPI000C048AB0|nr:uncharacterized protein LOC111329007 [Stylophora pistillata]